ncbi:hypothetical protein [uncultured Psychrobacter sp.]|uniref:hypothetical protein n=1 Tax=uncultured Psychrobacter sp. TaxID=259303 RepID=UPI0026251693|nr:hypothetical protein [uncultured Psychrobacter sp.]
MAAKTVTIESKDYVFNTLKEAQKYYNAIVKELFEAKLTLITGQDFEDFKWIYSTYCGYTKHNLDKLSEFDIIGIKGIRTIREKGGQYTPAECCAIVFSDGSEEEFYTDKALKEIAVKQNPCYFGLNW